MKSCAVILFLLIAGVCALPQDDIELGGGQERIGVVSRIQRAVDEMNRAIVDAGGDPFEIPYRSTTIVTPIGWAYAHVKGLKCTGASHNRFDRLNYNSVLMRLTFDLVWPEIACVIESKGAEAEILGREFSIWQSGVLLQVTELRVAGAVRMQLRLGRIIMRECELRLSAHLQSDLKVKVQDKDVSHKYNGAVEALNKHLRDNEDAIGNWICEKLKAAF